MLDIVWGKKIPLFERARGFLIYGMSCPKKSKHFFVIVVLFKCV